MLEIEGLTKRFGPITAVDNISFSVDRGEVLGFLGPNGAGKSTTMKMATGYLSPTSGAIKVCGNDVRQHPIEIKRRIGYLPEGAPLYGEMTPHSLLNFVSDVRQLSREQRRNGIDHAVESLHLERVLHQPIETLSKGYKRRVGLAQAIIHDPDVLVLDEPTDGLDPNQKHEVRELLDRMSSTKAIIISTHILEEVDAVCSRAIIISQGRIVADQMPSQLEERSRFHNAVGIRVTPDGAERCMSILHEISGVRSVEQVIQSSGLSELVAFPVDGGDIIGPVRAALDDNGLAVSEMFVEKGRLEDVFRDLTIGGPGDDVGGATMKEEADHA
ncbi:MAG: ATP-binding cassette domain-containing protein [Alphaproteobacteria bacterium]|nr:ATP-binding cassette domain-containing protein [Alphaproteobacteria bacterium]